MTPNGLTMLSKRTQFWLGLLNLALIVAVVSLSVTTGVPAARFPPKQKMMSYVICGVFVLSLLYQVIAQLPPIRFRIGTLMIFIAMLAVQLGLARVIAEMCGQRVGMGLFIVVVVFVPGLIRASIDLREALPGASRRLVGKLRGYAQKDILRRESPGRK
jgi:hypothetical protein